MNDGLPTVEWGQYFRGYTNPPDIPFLLGQLASDDEYCRKAVRHGLCELFYSRPEIIPPLVPYLLELVSPHTNGVKASALILLLTITGGLEPPPPDSDSVDTVQDRPDLAAAIRAALSKGQPLYVEAISDSDPNVREQATRIIYLTGDEAALPALRRQLACEQTPHTYVRLFGALTRLAPQRRVH